MAGFRVGGVNISLPDNVRVGGGGDIQLPIGGLGGSGGGDHIAAQNQAGADLGSVVNQYNALKASGGNTAAAVQSLVQRVNQIVSTFTAVVNQSNTARARQGLADITRLSGQVIASMTTNTGAVVDPGTGVVVGSGSGIGGVLAGMDTTTMLMLGLGAYFFLKKR